MLKNIMIGLFALLAVLIVISAFVTSGKTLFLSSPNRDVVYELRVKDGQLEHAIRHGGAQVLKWAPISLSGEDVSVKEIYVSQADHSKHEYLVTGFSRGIELDVRVDSNCVTLGFRNVPAGEFFEDIHILPEKGASFCRFTKKDSTEPFLGALAPKVNGNCAVYLDSEPTQIDGSEETFRMKYAHSYKFEGDGNALNTHVIHVVDDESCFEKVEHLELSGGNK